MMASKFATGASVSKNNQGEDEIVIQGDVGDEIVEMLRKEVKELKGAPVDQVVRVSRKYHSLHHYTSLPIGGE